MVKKMNMNIEKGLVNLDKTFNFHYFKSIEWVKICSHSPLSQYDD